MVTEQQETAGYSKLEQTLWSAFNAFSQSIDTAVYVYKYTTEGAALSSSAEYLKKSFGPHLAALFTRCYKAGDYRCRPRFIDDVHLAGHEAAVITVELLNTTITHKDATGYGTWVLLRYSRILKKKQKCKG